MNGKDFVARRPICELGAALGGIAARTSSSARGFISAKLVGRFGLCSEIAEDFENQEDATRARAKPLRNAAKAF